LQVYWRWGLKFDWFSSLEWMVFIVWMKFKMVYQVWYWCDTFDDLNERLNMHALCWSSSKNCSVCIAILSIIPLHFNLLILMMANYLQFYIHGFNFNTAELIKNIDSNSIFFKNLAFFLLGTHFNILGHALIIYICFGVS
jgi:hypothetical protein